MAQVYAQNVQDNLWSDGELVKYDGKFNTTYGALIKDNVLHVFSAKAADGQTAYVIPVTGRGLWGGLWGYIAINEDKTTVIGAYFYHEIKSCLDMFFTIKDSLTLLFIDLFCSFLFFFTIFAEIIICNI